MYDVYAIKSNARSMNTIYYIDMDIIAVYPLIIRVIKPIVPPYNHLIGLITSTSAVVLNI